MALDTSIRTAVTRPATTPSTSSNSSSTTSTPSKTNTPATQPTPLARRLTMADSFESAKPKAGPNLSGEAKPLSFSPPEVSGNGVTASGSASSNGVSADGSVTVGTDGVSAEGSVEVKGLKISFGTEISHTSNVESEDGFTTVTAEGTMSVNLGGEVDLGVGGFGANHTEGVRTKYEVRMSDEDYAKVQSGEAEMPDPFNPDSMPEGSSVLLNSTDFQGTGFEASYRNLSLETNVTQEQGVSVAVEKTGENTVRVTAGPTEAIENSFQLGLSLGPASVHIGNTTELDQFTLKTAEFDLSTDQGRAAYNNFLATGELPQDNSTGISDVATVEKINYNSTTSAGVELGPLSGSVDLGDSSLNIVKTTYPDGSVDQVTDAKLFQGSPVHLEQHFNPDGTEDPSKTKISMFLEGADGGAESEFANAYGVDQSDFDGDNDIYLEFTPEQATELTERAQQYIDQWEEDTGMAWEESSHLQDENLIAELAQAENPTEVARALIGAYGGPNWMGAAFEKMALGVDDFEPLPGTIEARDRNE
jgi:hypothetical protein